MASAQRQELEIMLHRAAQKVLHPTIMELYQIQDKASADERAHLLAELFASRQQAQTG